MTDFTPPLLANYISAGYQYLLYHNMDHCALIVPIKTPCELGEGSYLLPINDEQAFEMACGVDEFYFYVLS